MEVIGVFLLVAGAVTAATVLLARSVRNGRAWKEVHVTWGGDQYLTREVQAELERNGIRCQLRVIGTPDLGRMLPQRMSSVRVHRDDVAEAYRIIQAMRNG